ncbi:MAG TPA: ATP-binding protein, partial [Polyangiales bacterium]|nr:ATP-binding protein [Polyangiales bacterium]
TSPLSRLRADQPLPALDDAQSVELQSAFIEFCEQLGATQPLCLAIDDIERADASSARALAQLVRRVANAPLLVALAGLDERAPSNTALGSLLRQAVWIETAPLGASDCEAVVRSVFGDVPNVARVARWAHRHSHGHPGACMSLLEYMVSAGAAKFVAGSWQLPADADSLRLPEHGHEQLELALHGRAAGRSLLELLSLVTRPFPLELSQYAAALPEGGARALDELVQAQLVLATNQGYVMRDPSALDWAARELDDARRRELHVLLSACYEQYGSQHTIQVAYHAWQAGDLANADRLLERIELSQYGLRGLLWRSGGLGVPPQLFEELLAHRKRGGAAPADLYALRAVLLSVTLVSDVEMMRYAGETLDQLSHDVGLDLWDRTDPELTDIARAKRCFELARARYEASPEAQRGLPVERATGELVSCIATLGATCTFSFNVELTRKIASLIAPLRELNATSRLIARLMQLTHDSLVLGDRAMELRREILAATTREAAPDIDPVTRDTVHNITSYYLGLDLAADGRSEALELAEKLEKQPMYEVLGLQVRRTHALGCGQFDEAQRLRRRRELLALRTERSDNHLDMALLREQQAAFHCSDLLELNRALGALQARARRFPGWQPYAELCRAQLQFRADETDAANEVLEAALARLSPFAHDAWHGLNALLCVVKNERRDYAAARKLALTTLEGAAGLGIELNTTLRLRSALAVAQAGLGDSGAAALEIRQLIDASVAEIGPHSVVVGMLRESACRIALIAKDYASFSTQLSALGEIYANHPGLRSRHASWVREGKQRFRALIAVLEKANAAKDWSARIASRLSAHSAEDRSEYLLSFVLDELETDAGQLYRVTKEGKCQLLASRPGADEPQLMAAVEQSLITWWSSDEGQTADEETESAVLRDSHGRVYLPLWLTKPTHADELAGVVLLNCNTEQLSKLTPAFVKAVALHLETIA